MSALQDQYEKAVADEFFEWFNAERGTEYAFLRRAGEAPDLIYGWKGQELDVEITAGYYDGAHGEFLWKTARGAPDAPSSWLGVNPDKSLAESIAERIRDKCGKRYGSKTLLLVNVPPSTTSFEELERRLRDEELPRSMEFVGAFVCGRFPITTSSAGGYRVIAVKDFT